MWLVLAILGCNDSIEYKNEALLGDACDPVERPCRSDFICGHDAVCVEPGDPGSALADDDCLHNGDCAYGLVCAQDWHCAEPGDVGTLGAGESCTSDEDCQIGFWCGDSGTCEDLEIPYWEGVSCARAPQNQQFRFYFDVPELPAPEETEFYRLPFPNDARVVDGVIDLSAHPQPGEISPAVQRWIDAFSASGGFPLNPTVLFRASHRLNIASIHAFTDEPDTLFFADIDPDSDDYGPRSSFLYKATTARGHYICYDHVGVTVYPGVPLNPNTTYAVWISTDATDSTGRRAAQSDDLIAVLSDTRPGGDGEYRLVPAWDAYAPLRAYLDEHGIARSSVAVAAVFTTGDPAARMVNTNYALTEVEAPTAPSDLASCDAGDTSPCDDGALRGCAGPQEGFDEIHGHIPLPSFQEGSAPYASEGGGWSWDLSNTPRVRNTPEACFALAVPEGEPPPGGWPVAIVVPGQGETMREAINRGLAGRLANAPTPDGGTVGVAVLSVELPVHGDRGNDPSLWLNLENPEASLGNRLQVGADVHQLVRVINAWSVDAASSPTGLPIALDDDHIVLIGHGVGAEAALSGLAYSRGVEGVVFGGAGGLFADNLLMSRSPERSSQAVDRLLADTAVDRYHPVLAMMQGTLERSDALTYANMMVREPPVGAAPKHVLHIYGVDDLAAPDPVQQILQSAMGLPTGGDVLVDFDQSTRPLPVSENLLSSNGDRWTAVSIQLAGGQDALWSVEAQEATAAFVGAIAVGEAPTVE